MTVAAFMAAAASYAASTPTNAGYKVPVAKGASTAEVTLTLQKGTYTVNADKGTLAVDGAAMFENTLTVGAKGDFKFQITLEAPAGDKGDEVTLTFTPTTPEWTAFLKEKQDAINAIVSQSSALPTGDFGGPEELEWRTSLLERASKIQASKNECGIEEYSKWVETHTVESLEGIAQLQNDADALTANKNALDLALNKYKEEKASGKALDYSGLTTKYNGLESDRQAVYTKEYNSIKSKIDELEKSAKKIYLAQNAAANFDAPKLTAQINSLKQTVTNLIAAIDGNSEALDNWAKVDAHVQTAITYYNEQANNLYSQLVAKTLGANNGADVYTDIYEAAMAELNAVLRKVYEVKEANDAAKKAYDDETDINKKPEIKGLPDTWVEDDYKAEFQKVYDKYVTEKVGANGSTDATTLRGAYKQLTNAISNLRSGLSKYDNAKADKDTDKNGKVIGTWFTDQLSAIEKSVNTLEGKVNEANKQHKSVGYDIDAAGKADIDKALADLQPRLVEFNNYVKSRNTINTLETSTYKSALDKVDGYKYHDFIAKDRFSTAAIDEDIKKVKADARKNYQVDAGSYTYGGDVKATCLTIETNINTWKSKAEDAYNKYVEIYDDIDAYRVEIDGREEKDGKGITSWKDAVKNENVVIGGAAKGETYGQAKAKHELTKVEAQNRLESAMAISKTEENEFVKKLGEAYDYDTNPSTSVNDATEHIKKLKGSWAADEQKWQQETNLQAAKDAVAESERLLGESQTTLDGIKDYTKDTVGEAAKEKLDGDKKDIQDKIKSIQTKINEVNDLIPGTSDDFKGDFAAKAIEQINQVREACLTVSNSIDELKGNVKTAKGDFKAVSDNLTKASELINGREEVKDEKGNVTVSAIKSIVELLSPSNTDFTSEIAALETLIEGVRTDLNDAPVVGDARKDTPKTEETEAVKGLDSRCTDLLTAVDDLRQKALSESKNEENKQAWDKFLNNPLDAKKPTEADKAMAIIGKAKEDVKKTNPDVAESMGEEYFLGLIGDDTKGKLKAYYDLLGEADKAYKTTLKDSKFTDSANNLTDRKLEDLEKRTKALLNEIKGYPALSATNEAAKKAQDNRYTDICAKYASLRTVISASKPSGNKFTEIYNQALKDLTAVKDDLEKYGKDKEAEYGKGASEAFDAKATLPKLTKIEAKVSTLAQTWAGDENTDRSYLYAVAKDNEARYKNFNDAATALSKAYYGTTVGANHTDGAIDIVTKLSKLSYANQVDPADYETLVSGDDGLYAYANKIAELQEKVKKDYEATKAPVIWDATEAFKDEASGMQKTIEEKEAAYAKLVNDYAVKVYASSVEPVKSLIEQAREDVKYAGLAANDEAADKLLDAKKRLLVNKGAITIYQEAVKAYNGGIPDVDFAYRLDNEFLPGFADIASLLDASKEMAAQTAWSGLLAAVNSDADAKAMKDFWWNEEWDNAALADFTKGTAPTDFYVEHLPTTVTFEDYVAWKEDYEENAVQTRTIDTGKKDDKGNSVTADETHTMEYWRAYDSNEKYNQLLADDKAVQLARETLVDSWSISNSAIHDLLIEHDVDLVAKLANLAKDIQELNSVSAQANIAKEIDALDKVAIYKELQAMNIEMNNMKQYLELNKVEGVAEKVDALQQRNTDIFNRFNVGTPIYDEKDKDKIVGYNTATAEDTYNAYRALEKETGALKTSYDKTVANDVAEVAKAVSGLKACYAELETRYAGMFLQTQDEYKDEFNAVAPQIKSLEEKVAAQGTAVSIEKENNLKAVANITKSIKTLSAALAHYNQDYVDNETWVNEQLALLDQYEGTDLAGVVTKGESLKNKQEVAKYDEDGNFINTVLYVQDEAAKIRKEILDEEDPENVTGAKVLLGQLVNYVKSDRYESKMAEADKAVGGIKDAIGKLEVTILNYDVDAETRNVDEAIKATQYEIESRIPDGASLRETLLGEVSSQKYEEKYQADLYKDSVRNGYYDQELEAWIAPSIVANHDEVMANYQAVLDALEEIKGRIVTPGAIGDGQTVAGSDVARMVDLILGREELDEILAARADIDEDSEITIADLVKVRNYFLYRNYNGYTSSDARRMASHVALAAGNMGMAVHASSLAVSLDSEIGYAGVQMDVTLPAGLILTDAAFAGAGEVNADFNKIGDHTWRIVLYAADGESVNVSSDLVSLSLAGAGNGEIVIDNVKGSNAVGALIRINGVTGSYSGATGISATVAQAKAYFYGVDGTVRKGISKGITIVKEAGNKVRKVLTK